MKSLDPLGVQLAGTNLIEASAGTGKTYTITMLYPRLLLELGLNTSQILVVTYTNAATAELRTRIRRRLREILGALESGEPSADENTNAFVRKRIQTGHLDEDRNRLLEALRSFDEAAVFTIHSFCQRVLQENAFESGVPFDVQLMSDETLLRREVVHDFWSRELHAASEVFVRHLQEAKVKPDHLSDLACRVVGNLFMPVLPPCTDVDLTTAAANWQAARTAAASIWRSHGRMLIHLLADSPALNGNIYRPKTIRENWPARMETALMGSVSSINESFPEFTKWTNAGLESGRKKGKIRPTHAFFDACDRLFDADQYLLAALQQRMVKFWVDLTAYARKEFQERKERLRALSFDDLLYRLRSALTGPGGEELAKGIRGRFRAALIDEFQDTDPVQYEIFQHIYHGSGAPLFLIGDPKQAIYAFRGADIFAYISARGDAGAATHTLEVNRRSGPTLLRGINILFERARNPFVLPTIPYMRMEAAPSASDMLGGGAQGRAPVEILFVPRRGQKGNGGWINKGLGHSELPRLVAAELSSFLASGATIADRKVMPEDVAVLCRTNAQARAMQEALRELSIPCVLQSEASVLETSEAMELERVLRAIAEPGNNRAIRVALAGCVFGLDAAALRVLNEQEEQWEIWVQRFHDWNELWLRNGFTSVFRRILVECTVTPRLLRTIDGERRLTNLLHLSELIETAAREVSRGPSALVRWFGLARIDAAASRSLSSDAAQIRLESDARAVQLVTIHKSKGLEYPIVYCPFLWEGTLLHKGEETWVRFHDPDDRYRLKLDVGSDHIADHLALASNEARAENMRLLYVALTRAKQRCTIVWGAFRGAEQSPLGYLLHQPPGCDREIAAATADRITSATDEEMRNDLTPLIKEAAGAIELRDISFAPGEPYCFEVGNEPVLHCRNFDSALNSHWRTASFSALLSAEQQVGPAAEVATIDYDENLAEPFSSSRKPDAVLLADFPAGPQAGNLIHEIFEHIDFVREDPEELSSVVSEGLNRYTLDSCWHEPLCRAIDEVLATPLGAKDRNIQLRRVTRTRRLNELEFLFPVAPETGSRKAVFTGARMAEVFEEHASQLIRTTYVDHLAQLEFAPLAGFLRGFIDLVFENDGRWYLIDYKSNLLGPRPEDYAPAQLLDQMAVHHYFLQYHLYVIALHRYLKTRLRGYDYDRHFGGVFYLFVRGMSPTHPAGSGVFCDLPPRSLVEGLSGLMSQLEQQ